MRRALHTAGLLALALMLAACVVHHRRHPRHRVVSSSPPPEETTPSRSPNHQSEPAEAPARHRAEPARHRAEPARHRAEPARHRAEPAPKKPVQVRVHATPPQVRPGQKVTIHLKPAVSPVMVYFNGRVLPKIVRGNALKVTVPGNASSGRFEIEWEGRRFQSNHITVK